MAKQIMRQHMQERFGKVLNFCSTPPFPQSLNIELNSSCNQKCIFCPFHGKYAVNNPKPAVMPVQKAKMIIDEAKKIGIGEKEIGFYMSGEAFLYNDLADIIAYTKNAGFTYLFLTTNGALATPQKMKAVLDAGLDSIRFSINATDRETYMEIHGRDDFDVVCENIRWMREYLDETGKNVATSVSCVITKKTSGIQKKIMDIFGKYVDDICFFPVIVNRLNCDEDFLEKYQLFDESNAKINPEYICPMLFNTMYINANLEVAPCCEAYDYNCSFYDLKEDFNLENAWACEGYRRYRDIFLNKASDEGTVCKRCFLRMKGVEGLTID